MIADIICSLVFLFLVFLAIGSSWAKKQYKEIEKEEASKSEEKKINL